ncbi:hypothetical protein ABIE78_004080 [Sinorhizobium fredii]|jgi:hypothetical protein|uniref:Glutamine synthetase translation inhibitor protein n=1 Tax=Sinorhizobium fredii (strain USDA 257) TaxID=1185652 RepID=I3X2M2_SINF2|nr:MULTISPECIES: DUF2735 domain-containing protein [Sinorhizobium]AFL50128.1 glutamine synthetase translation inhibitor protein [Sinorhizobium fredii USDA 257]
MATSFHGKTATILQFPTRISRKAEDRHFEAQRKAELASSDVCAAAIDGCWYHEEAVREETSTKH